MKFTIGIVDVIANAMIETLKLNPEKRFLTYKEIEEYGAKVVDFLDGEAVLILSWNGYGDTIRDYSDYFRECIVNGERGIALKKDVQIEDLINQFRGYLAFDVLLAFISEESVRILKEGKGC